MTSSGLALADRLRDAVNRHDLDAMTRCFATDFVNETPVHPARSFRVLSHQVCGLEHLQVLGDRRTTHRQRIREFSDRTRTLGETLEDRSPGGIPECTQPVQRLVRRHEP